MVLFGVFDAEQASVRMARAAPIIAPIDKWFIWRILTGDCVVARTPRSDSGRRLHAADPLALIQMDASGMRNDDLVLLTIGLGATQSSAMV